MPVGGGLVGDLFQQPVAPPVPNGRAAGRKIQFACGNRELLDHGLGKSPVSGYSDEPPF